MTDEPILRSGDHGEWVRHLQQMLTVAGHDPGPADGAFGDRTLASVWAYQSSFGLVVDGVVGPDTWFQLYVPPSLDTVVPTVRRLSRSLVKVDVPAV
ncbi:peptidoglycan-binding domain-containing protein [Phytohabitans houttuyneae]|uniref:Peptidoglycan binding-like domain-containing protein n=1 Tax=Phytohabitans houttuyneae TaxID=1076126 RepID=A0A6V8KHC5_9ACTN|nr:peptidoglycan-binding domain-containing protein [Phytohabitans houttuyneae]GFJ81406.1 hypothetical protein Phou_055860 [Phytohabitans houttuyneae]